MASRKPPKPSAAATKPKPAAKQAAKSGATKSAAKSATTSKAKGGNKPAAAKAKAKQYIPNADEKYMCQRHKRYFREQLKGMLASIRINSEKTIDSLKDDVAAIPDDNDRASKEAEFTLELRERERERRLKQKIDHAMRRIDKGEFGLCEECGEPIGIERLVARPVAVYCFECKQLQERREKTGN